MFYRYSCVYERYKYMDNLLMMSSPSFSHITHLTVNNFLRGGGSINLGPFKKGKTFQKVSKLFFKSLKLGGLIN